MKTISIGYFIKKEQERKYFYLPFDVPEGVESLEIEYSYYGDKANANVTEKGKNVIDFGLIDNDGDDMGTRGSECHHIFISPNFSTNGFKRKEIKAGVWQIIVGAYQVRLEGVEITYKLIFHLKKYRWLKGDTHIHTDHSDGSYSRDAISKKAEKKGLDFIIITDHNNNLEGEAMPKVKNLTVIKGLEFTNYRGHMNIWGVGKAFNGSYAINSKEEFLKCCVEASERGAVLSINHPMCDFCPWDYGFDNIPYDAVEVWNGPMRKMNLRAVEWWNGELKTGKRIPVVGGSDYHRDFLVTNLFAIPCTRVYADSASDSAILAALKAGHSVITQNSNSTMVEMKYGDKVIGDEAEYDEKLKLEIKVEKLKKGHTLKVIDNIGVYHTFKAKRKGDYSFSIPVRVKGFIRCEVEYKPRLFGRILYKTVMYFILRKEFHEKTPLFLYVITNPIYIK